MGRRKVTGYALKGKGNRKVVEPTEKNRYSLRKTARTKVGRKWSIQGRKRVANGRQGEMGGGGIHWKRAKHHADCVTVREGSMKGKQRKKGLYTLFFRPRKEDAEKKRRTPRRGRASPSRMRSITR